MPPARLASERQLEALELPLRLLRRLQVLLRRRERLVDWLRAGIDVRTVQEWLGRDGMGLLVSPSRAGRSMRATPSTPVCSRGVTEWDLSSSARPRCR
jgi:hypothetical protein